MKTLLILLFTILTVSCTKHDSIESNVIDIDGHLYDTQTIGAQIWLTPNLSVQHYNDGTAIEDYIPNKYTHYMVDSHKLCPTGYHVPADWEFYMLVDYCDDHGIEIPFDEDVWWTSTPIVDGYICVQAWAWEYYNHTMYRALADDQTYLNVKCIKD